MSFSSNGYIDLKWFFHEMQDDDESQKSMQSSLEWR